MSTALAHRVGGLVREAARAHGATQVQLARRLGLSQQAVSRRLTGEVDFAVSELGAIAEFLEISLAELLAGVA